MPLICPSRLSKNSFARKRGRNFVLFVGPITEKFLPPIQHKPSEETVFYAGEANEFLLSLVVSKGIRGNNVSIIPLLCMGLFSIFCRITREQQDEVVRLVREF